MLEAIYNAVIVKPIEVETQSGNIIVPDTTEESGNKFGEVVSVGPGAYSVMGELIPTQLKVGDKVLLPTMGFTKFNYEGEEYFVGREMEILGKI